MPPKPVPIEERFWCYVAPMPDDRGCWEWFGARRSQGHGVIGTKFGKPGMVASRLSWVIHVGPIPDGLFVCHRCDNPPCVNPAHLFLGTAKDNFDDMFSKGRHNLVPGILKAAEIGRARTHCKRGHSHWAVKNERGHRRCVACHRERSSVAWRKKAEAKKEQPRKLRTLRLVCQKGHDDWRPIKNAGRSRYCHTCKLEKERAKASARSRAECLCSAALTSGC
jgi:HNH endonuclease